MQNINNTTSEGNNQSNKGIDHRRKRVNRIKAAIIIIGIILLILPTILCIILGIQVSHLQRQMKDLIQIHSEYGLIYEESDQLKYAYAAELPAISNNHVEDTQRKGLTPEVQSDESKVIPTLRAELDQIKLIPTPKITPVPKITPTPKITPVPKITPTPRVTPAPKVASIQITAIPTPLSTKAIPSQPVTKPDKEKKSEKKVANSGKYSDRTVYLTFDDGPSIYTSEILDIFAEYKVKATFFVVGKTDKTSKELYQRIIEEGHTLGMHSYSHNYDKIYNSVEDFDKDFTKLWKLLYDTTGYKPCIYRFPGGSNNKVNKHGMEKFIHYLNKASIVYFDWNALNGDATGVEYTKEELIDNVLNGVAKKKTSIVLLHDSQSKKTTVDSLPDLLEELIEGGAQILPLDKDVKPIQMIKADSVN